MNQLTYKILVASKVKGVGRKTLRKLVKDYGLLEHKIGDWHQLFSPFKELKPGSTQYTEAIESVDLDIQHSLEKNDFIFSFIDNEYPESMKGNSDGAILLYVRGDSSCLRRKSLAIIGTREPTSSGEEIALRVTENFVNRGWGIVSGLAKGIDTIAHRSTISNNGTTIAVLSGSLDDIYPKENTELAHEIVRKSGALISEYSYRSKNFKTNFVERDRIQAAISAGVILIQSDIRGGSWYASRAAMKYGRKLAVIYPTPKDINLKKEKIQGNIHLHEADMKTRASFLETSEENLRNLSFLYTKDDFNIFENSLNQEIFT